MSTPIRIHLTNGQVINAMSYRMDPSFPGSIKGPQFWMPTILSNGWRQFTTSEVAHIEARAGRPT